MSRVAKAPILIPGGVEVAINGQEITIKGKNGTLNSLINKAVNVAKEDNQIVFSPKEDAVDGWAQAGTARSIINNMVLGVTEGFTRKLQLVGVGFRAAIKGNSVALTIGYSHPVEHELPNGVSAECPSQTEIVLKSNDKQLLGQVAADIRAYRRPEPYKGKGIRYSDEVVRSKEAKKK
ncbi:50S ribosomal protein L6 [Thorsellia kenyensis]|uniref:Large ribosomal subunit protein uL6 n=1 Tax=Thorsellia kenyensis TaxID=1549888 RepID=A0ABV6CCW0_9GAMM